MGNIVTLKTLDSSIISLIILLFILFNSCRRFDRMFPDRKLFVKLVIFNIFIIIVDLLSWSFNGLEGAAFSALNAAFVCLYYIATPAAPMLWLLYVDYQIYHNEERLRKTRPVLYALLAVNAVFSIISLYTGWFFIIDANNVYSRGPLLFIYAGFIVLLVAYSAFLVLKNRRVLQKRVFYSLLFLYVPPVAGMLLQSLTYGVSYNWVGMAVSLLVFYLNVQNSNLNTDYLTGAYNRRRLEEFKESRLKSTASETAFSAIMFDLDNLKQINDELGHDAGDEALKETVDIVKRSIRESDFVARVGGDEFIIILNIETPANLKEAKKRIERSVAAFNKAGKKPYKLSLSYGYRVYDPKSGEKMDKFFKDIDSLMYMDKNKKRVKHEE